MAVPFTFGSATAAIPLSQLDTNFATTITLGNTAIQLGNTVTTLNNMTLGNVTVSSGNVTVSAGSNTSPSITTVGDTNTGLFFPAADTIAFTEGGVESMRIDSSGNVGLGVTPTTGGYGKGFQISQASNNLGTFWTQAISDNDHRISITDNAKNTGVGAWAYFASSQSATMYQQATGQHQWYTAPTGTAGNAISFTQAMTLDASGNLALGSTSILGSTNRASFTNATSAKGVLALQSTSTSGYSAVELYDNSGTQQGAMGWGNASVAVTGAASAIYLYSSGAITFLSGGTTERARIDTSGNLLVGMTNTSGEGVSVFPDLDTGGSINVRKGAAASGARFMIFDRSGSQVGTITYNGSGTNYNTSSDYRLKNAVAPMTGALAKVAALKPCTYKWNVDGSDGQGFIAHELAEVEPGCVTGEKDAVDAEGNPQYQGIDTSFLVATLTAAIQEQQALIQSLTDRITALETA